jgi:hypothetical protein
MHVVIVYLPMRSAAGARTRATGEVGRISRALEALSVRHDWTPGSTKEKANTQPPRRSSARNTLYREGGSTATIMNPPPPAPDTGVRCDASGLLDLAVRDTGGHALFRLPGSAEDLQHVENLAAQQGFLHLQRGPLQRMHRFEGSRLAGAGGIDLLLDDRRRVARPAGVVKKQMRLQIVHGVAAQPERTHDNPIARAEFHEVEATERGRVLVLLAAGEAAIHALDLVRELRDLVFAQRKAQVFRVRLDHGDDQCGG